LVIQGRLMTTEEKQIKSEQDLELERERTRQLNDEIARLKRAVEQSRSATPTSTDAARVSELETLLAQARADVGKFQALAEKNATAYQNAMARLFPALTSLSAR
jgi:flagellar biosynthesis chaperone FliJ